MRVLRISFRRPAIPRILISRIPCCVCKRLYHVCNIGITNVDMAFYAVKSPCEQCRTINFIMDFFYTLYGDGATDYGTIERYDIVMSSQNNDSETDVKESKAEQSSPSSDEFSPSSKGLQNVYSESGVRESKEEESLLSFDEFSSD